MLGSFGWAGLSRRIGNNAFMPKRNHFKHQKYSDQSPGANYRLVDAKLPPAPGTAQFNGAIASFSDRIVDFIDAIHITHGTFAGNDAFGWIAQIEKAIPDSGTPLRTLGKKFADIISSDSGNYPAGFAKLFDVDVPVNMFTWSGENTHSGRCRAAIELLAKLFERVEDQPRVLLWGHSHAGNIAALVTNLLGADDWVRDQFFSLLTPLFDDRKPNNALQKVRKAVEDPELVAKLTIDVVNFGTPICYGWDSGGYRKLLHVVSHQPRSGKPEYLAPILSGGIEASMGDMAQLLGITGSNFWPYLLTQSTRDTEKKLHEFLAPDLSRKDYLQRLRLGMRVAEEGTTLLVDYDNAHGWAKELAGHAIYTRKDWLAFHVQTVGDELYG